ncbi:hypothetical protein LCM23_14580 [Cytobacillus kochii]|uniref:hypothetical protein n=1 Tax=Cytobacillus kochii TaxID=859143 RepID=UPI001CD76BF5|nr:hypothetical protein [Cytobacillus kochii]MCA1027324.1 hypothetical protein [Cytobacillus kochii]
MDFKKGEIVYSNKSRMQGKVIKVNKHNDSALVEFILSQNKEMMIRTTQLQILSLKDLFKIHKRINRV